MATDLADVRQRLICELQKDAERYRALLRDINTGKLTLNDDFSRGVLAARLADCEAPDELVQRASRGEFCFRRPSPSIEEMARRASESANVARSGRPSTPRVVDEIPAKLRQSGDISELVK